MNDVERFEMALLFLAVTREFLADRLRRSPDAPRTIVVCSRTFAATVDEEVARGNIYAAKWPVHDAVDGRRCEDFMTGLTSVQVTGILGSWSDRFDRVFVLLSKRRANEILRSQENLREAAERFVESYIKKSERLELSE